jgi:hypothetical protein
LCGKVILPLSAAGVGNLKESHDKDVSGLGR